MVGARLVSTRVFEMMRKLRRCVLPLAILFSAVLIPTQASAHVPTVFRHLGNDVSSTFGSWPLSLILGGGIAAGELTQVDEGVAGHFRGHPRLGKFDRVADIAGEPYVVFPAAALTFGIAKLAGDERIALTGEAMTEAVALAEGGTLALKGIFRRTRPDGGSLSFPSAHAASTFAVAGVLETLHGPAIGIPAFLVASFISFTRIDQDSHSLSDVVFGAAWGAAIGWGTARYHRKLREERFLIVPTCAGNPGLGIIAVF